MRYFLKEWENISPQYYKLRADRLLNLQSLSEIYVRLFGISNVIKFSLIKIFLFSISPHYHQSNITPKQLEDKFKHGNQNYPLIPIHYYYGMPRYLTGLTDYMYLLTNYQIL